MLRIAELLVIALRLGALRPRLVRVAVADAGDLALSVSKWLQVIPAFEEAVAGMRVGSIRR
jgi:hypothetical protein